MLDHHFLTTKMLVPVQWLEFHVFSHATAQKLCITCALSVPNLCLYSVFYAFAQKSCRSLNAELVQTHDGMVDGTPAPCARWGDPASRVTRLGGQPAISYKLLFF